MRFFKFLECFSKAFESFYASVGAKGVLEVGKWSCLGAYLFLESLTIVSLPSDVFRVEDGVLMD